MHMDMSNAVHTVMNLWSRYTTKAWRLDFKEIGFQIIWLSIFLRTVQLICRNQTWFGVGMRKRRNHVFEFENRCTGKCSQSGKVCRC